jgi:response regulator RpfG family c-di-GMP phosphodiesterase
MATAVPVFGMDDIEDYRTTLTQELQKRSVPIHFCRNKEELIGAVEDLECASIFLDVDMGTSRRREGLDAALHLKQMPPKKRGALYVAILTSHREYHEEASRAGVDAFIIKTNPITDALELMIRLANHAIEVSRLQAEPIQSELAEREYENLLRQMKGQRDNLLIPLGTLRRALNWPFLEEGERCVLAALEEQLDSAESRGVIDDDSLAICISGAELLATDRARSEARFDWIKRLRMRFPGGVFRWLSGREFEEESDE